MSWWEATPGLEFLVGMPSNARLLKEVQKAQRPMAAEFAATQESQENRGPQQEPPRTFVEIPYRTLDSWSQPRRVEVLQTQAAAARTAADWLSEQASWEGKSNVRFVVLSRSAEELDGRTAYEEGYCPRGGLGGHRAGD